MPMPEPHSLTMSQLGTRLENAPPYWTIRLLLVVYLLPQLVSLHPKRGQPSHRRDRIERIRTIMSRRHEEDLGRATALVGASGRSSGVGHHGAERVGDGLSEEPRSRRGHELPARVSR